MNGIPTTGDLQDVERRIEARRTEVAHRYDEVKEGFDAAVARAARSWPLLVLGGSLAVGYAISRGTRTSPAPQVCYGSATPGAGPVRTYAYAAPAETSHRMRKVAAVLGVAATAVRVVTSGEARALVNAFRALRGRR